MAFRDMWKLLHALHVYGPGITRGAIRKAGVVCAADSIGPLVDCGAVESHPPGVPYEKAREYRLSKAALGVLQNCVVANRRLPGDDLRVDEPSVFAVMPFSQPWSNAVYNKLIRSAAKDAGLECVRGDSIDRTGDLTANILREIFRAGLVLADLTGLNPNVLYELGLCHAIGRDAIILKQPGVDLPADLKTAHYYEYRPEALEAGRKTLAKALRDWARSRCAVQVRALGK